MVVSWWIVAILPNDGSATGCYDSWLKDVFLCIFFLSFGLLIIFLLDLIHETCSLNAWAKQHGQNNQPRNVCYDIRLSDVSLCLVASFGLI